MLGGLSKKISTPPSGYFLVEQPLILCLGDLNRFKIIILLICNKKLQISLIFAKLMVDLQKLMHWCMFSAADGGYLDMTPGASTPTSSSRTSSISSASRPLKPDRVQSYVSEDDPDSPAEFPKRCYSVGSKPQSNDSGYIDMSGPQVR